MSKPFQRTPEDIQRDVDPERGQTQNSTATRLEFNKIDPSRYRKVRWFFAKALLHVIWWDIILNRPLMRWFRKPLSQRWQKIACRYRALALEMGGVLIKLGQFLSIRVDILPPEVTGELVGLQDEIPPETFLEILAQIEEDFGKSVSEIFSWIAPKPLGATSLAQAHLARLETGQEVVVKVLRPRINILVETDLAAIAWAIGWIKFYQPPQ